MLRTTVDTVCTVISLATQWSGMVEPNTRGGDAMSRGLADDPGGGGQLDPIISYAGDPTVQILEASLRRLGEDEQADLLAMLWLGRGDVDAEDWEEACDRTDEELGRSDAVALLLDSPHLAAHLTEALQQLGYECPEDRAEDGAAGPA